MEHHCGFEWCDYRGVATHYVQNVKCRHFRVLKFAALCSDCFLQFRDDYNKFYGKFNDDLREITREEYEVLEIMDS